MRARPVMLGVALAAVFIVTTHALAGDHRLEVFALFLALTACVYGGAALTPAGTAFGAIELPFVVLVFACAVAGVVSSPAWIAAGYLAHGGWDLLHHLDRIRTPVIRAFPSVCAVFDILVGGFVLLWWLRLPG